VFEAEQGVDDPAVQTALAGRKPDQEWLDSVIDTVGLEDRLSHRPAETTERFPKC